MADRQIEEIILKISVDDSRSSKNLTKFNKQTKQATKNTNNFKSGLGGLKSAIIALGLAKLAGEALEVAKQFDKIDNSLKTVTGSQAAANKQFKFLNEISDDLGVSLLTVADGYVKLLGATKGTPLAGKVTKELAQGVFELSTAMGLAESETSGIINAIAQIATKGKLSSEELQQLAERGVPAFQLASKAIGVTTQELTKMLEQGKVLSEDFLPKFAKQLRTDFAGAADAASNSIQANSNRLKNEWARSIEGGGKALAKFIPLITSTIGLINDFGTAAKEAAVGTNIWLDQILGIDDQFNKPFTDVEKAQQKAALAARNLAKEQKAATAEAKELAAAQKKVVDALAKVDSLLSVESGFTFDRLTENLIKNLGLTALEAEKLGPAIKASFEEGADVDDISGNVLGIIKLWKDELNKVEINEEKLINPFNEILRKATLLQDALNFSDSLGLTAKEFEKISAAIIKAREQGLSKEEIKAQIEGLRDVGFFEEDEKKKVVKARDSGPVQSAFQSGTAEGSAFLQSINTEVESLDQLKQINKNTKNQTKVDLIAK